MTSDAARTQPRKRAWKRLIVALACVVTVVTIVLLANAAKQEPVRVWFVSSTNYLGYKKLIFQVTNALRRDIDVYALTAARDRDQADTLRGMPSYYDRAFAAAAAGTNFYFILDVPPYDVPYYVEWGFYDSLAPATRWGKLRKRCHDFFLVHRMPRLAKRFEAPAHRYYIPSSEIKE